MRRCGVIPIPGRRNPNNENRVRRLGVSGSPFGLREESGRWIKAYQRAAVKKSWQPILLYAVVAREVDPPRGQEPNQWVLVTDWKVDRLEMAVRMIQWHSVRWGIESWHQTLKDVCKVQKRQEELDPNLRSIEKCDVPRESSSISAVLETGIKSGS